MCIWLLQAKRAALTFHTHCVGSFILYFAQEETEAQMVRVYTKCLQQISSPVARRADIAHGQCRQSPCVSLPWIQRIFSESTSFSIFCNTEPCYHPMVMLGVQKMQWQGKYMAKCLRDDITTVNKYQDITKQ